MGIEKTVQVAQAEQQLDQIYQQASQLEASKNWELGALALKAYHLGGTDQKFADVIDSSNAHSNTLRRVVDRYGELHTCVKKWPHLKWGHFKTAVDWNDDKEALDWANDMQASVRQMIAWRNQNHPHAGASIANYDQDAESGESETHHAIALEGKGSEDRFSSALEERTPNPVSASAPNAVSGDSHGEERGEERVGARPSILKVTPETTKKIDTSHVVGQVYTPVAQTTKPQEPIGSQRETDVKSSWEVFFSRAKAIADLVQRKALATVMRKAADELDPPTKKARFVPPSVQEVQDYCDAEGIKIDVHEFWLNHDKKGWKDIKNWHSAVKYWARDPFGYSAKKQQNTSAPASNAERRRQNNRDVIKEMTGVDVYE